MCVVGCARRQEAAVSGAVTLDGSPLDDATISFAPVTKGQQQAAWTTITAGRYAIAPSEGLGIGASRVEIRALRTAGDKSAANDPTLPTFGKEIVPAKYNSNSQLVVEIRPGENIANFDLKSK
jgi:hypothetical protein